MLLYTWLPWLLLLRLRLWPRFWSLPLHFFLLLLLPLLELLRLLLVLLFHFLAPSIVGPLLFSTCVLLFLLPLQVLPFLFLFPVHVV